MATTLKLGNSKWATKDGSLLAYNDENGNFKPLPFNFERSTGATRVNKQGLIEVVGNNEPRIDFTDDSKGALLLEPQRTNTIAYSNKFDTYWSLVGLGTGSAPVLNNDSVISPDGNQNATEVILNAGSGTTTSDRSSIEVNQTVSAGSEYTVSFYIKGKNDGDQLMIGAISGDYELITLTTEWKRYVITQTAASSPRAVFIGIRQGVFGTLNNNVEFYLYGTQLEQGSYATSYIPTSGSAVTRVAETCNGAGDANTFNDSEGVLMAEISALDDDETNRLISLTNGSSSERISLFYSQDSSNEIKGIVFVGGSAVGEVIYNSIDITTNLKVALKYKANDLALWINGIEVVTDNLSSTPTGLDRLNFDLGISSSVLPFYGNTKQLQYYNTALTDAELEKLTKI